MPRSIEEIEVFGDNRNHLRNFDLYIKNANRSHKKKIIRHSLTQDEYATTIAKNHSAGEKKKQLQTKLKKKLEAKAKLVLA